MTLLTESSIMRFISFLLILYVFGFSTVVQAQEMPELKQIPQKEIEFMLNADQVDLYSVPAHPKETDPHGILGFPIWAHVQIKSEETKKVLISAFRLAAEASGHWFACFDPHHIFRFKKGDESHTFTVCFQCGEARELIQKTGVSDSHFKYRICPYHGAAFNAILDAGAPDFRSKALFIGSYATSDIDAGEEISLSNADTREDWRDQLSGGELGKLNFDRLPKASKAIKRGDFFTKENTVFQNP